MTKEMPDDSKKLHSNNFTDPKKDLYEIGKNIIDETDSAEEHIERRPPGESNEANNNPEDKTEVEKADELRKLIKGDLDKLDELKEQLNKIKESMKECEEKAEERARRIESLEITGDIIADSKAYAEAAGLKTENMSDEWKDSFQNEDKDGILEYFKTLKKANENIRNKFPESIAKCMERECAVIEKIITKADEEKKKKDIKEKIDSL